MIVGVLELDYGCVWRRCWGFRWWSLEAIFASRVLVSGSTM